MNEKNVETNNPDVVQMSSCIGYCAMLALLLKNGANLVQANSGNLPTLEKKWLKPKRKKQRGCYSVRIKYWHLVVSQKIALVCIHIFF